MKKGLLLSFVGFAIAHAATLPDMQVPNSNYYIAGFTFTDGVDPAAFSWNYINQTPPYIALSLTNIPVPLDVTFLVALFPQTGPPIQTLTASFTASTLPGTVAVDMSHIYDVVIPKTGLPSSGERVTISIPGAGLESGTVKLLVFAPEPCTYSLLAGAVGLLLFFNRRAAGKENFDVVISSFRSQRSATLAIAQAGVRAREPLLTKSFARARVRARLIITTWL